MPGGFDFDDDPDSVQEQEQEEDGQERQATAVTLMGEAQRRFALAQYYMELTKSPVFQDGSEEADIVANEVREFAMERMEVLLGLRAPKAEVVAQGQFEPEEVEVLKQMVARVLNKASVVPAQAPKPAPEVVRAPPPAAKRPAPPPPPQKPAPKAPARRPAPKKPAPQPAPKAQASSKRRPEDVPDGEVFKQNGKLWKWESAPGPADCPCEKCAAGEPHRFRRNVTIQRGNPAAVPMPAGQGLEIATANLAQATLQTGANALDRRLRRGAQVDEIQHADGSVQRTYVPPGADPGLGDRNG